MPLASASDTGVIDVDFSVIRGANYTTVRGHHYEHWVGYDPEETVRDLDFAKQVNINHIRIVLSRPAYLENPEAFRSNLIHLARECQKRDIGLMLVVANKAQWIDESAPYPLFRAWAKDLIDTVGHEPSLQCWDVFNEPDLPHDGPARSGRIERANAYAQIFSELDTRRPRTPITIGFALESAMEENVGSVDVLSYHDYASTRRGIRQTIAAAVACAEQHGKPLINTEIGCTGRANPYDVAIEEYTNARVGFYIWELMVAPRWGDVHGIFYADGTVRDPSIAAAMLGMYRNRSVEVVLENPDRENWVTRTVDNGRGWLNDPNASYDRGLEIAEQAANLLEANQLVAMRELPTRKVELIRNADPDTAALRRLLQELIGELEPYRRDSN